MKQSNRPKPRFSPPATVDPPGMPKARRHHTVPRFYLRQWADAERRVQALDVQHDRLVTRAVRSASAETDFYLAETVEGLSDLGIERLLSWIENHAATALRRLMTDPELVHDRSVRAPLSGLIAYQAVRGPRERERFFDEARASMEQGFHLQFTSDESIQARLQSLGRDDDADAIAEARQTLAEMRSGTYTMSRTDALGHMLSSAGYVMQEIVLAYWWHVVRLNEPLLLTSDHPFTPGPEVGTKSTYLFPLHPRLLLIMLPERPTEPLGVFRDANFLIAKNAKRWVYGPPGWPHWDTLRGILRPATSAHT